MQGNQNNHPDTNAPLPVVGKPRVVREEWVHKGKWLGLKHVHWADATGRERVCCGVLTDATFASPDACIFFCRFGKLLVILLYIYLNFTDTHNHNRAI